jgi:hypothetical protein
LHAGLVCVEPSSYAQAESIPEWRAAMDSEFQSLLQNDTWSLCSRPLVRIWFHVNGFLNSNGDLTAVLNVTRPD